ncbi:MAG: pyridoxamine 5'-phosphate oxidase family protein [Rhodospirillales bacterium]|jgi:nitroimidazol reductase NimA-like FMN-containing flavoprotein (pyridoxamine 5'-phosphate oxidase superfamily)
MMKSIGGISIEGPWDAENILDFLNKTRVPMRIAVNRPSGYPMVTPVWHHWADGALWSATRPNSALARALKRDDRCSFDISIDSPPYRGVRGRGRALLQMDGGALLGNLIEKFMSNDTPKFREMLLRKAEDEYAIKIIPDRLTSWDFTNRMSG